MEAIKSILAGIFISLAGLAYLKIGGVIGAVLFSFGLLGVIMTDSLLYTGRIYYERFIKPLSQVLLWNVVGCAIFGLMSRASFPELKQTAEEIIATRINDGYLACFLKGSFCGVIMTGAVMGMKEKQPWLLFFGIPMFILSGFYHSVADSFYFFMAPDLWYLPKWCMIVLGNFLGGRLYFLKSVWMEK